MKMKALDCALIGILASLASQAAYAQEQQVAADAVTCTDAACADANGEVLMRVRTRGERQPLTVNAPEESPALQPDRRVTVETEQRGKAVAIGKWSVQLPGGGVIWATEDPNLGQPRLDVSATSQVPFDGTRVTRPVRFYIYNNYTAFIDRLEVLVFRASDSDLVTPLATVQLNAAAVVDGEWDGTLPAGFQARAGDELAYVVRAYGKDGSFDETYPHRFQLVTPDEAERGALSLRTATERKLGQSLDTQQAEALSQIDSTFGNNSLRVQNIPIYGSRIRIQGRNLPENSSVTINGRAHPLDMERKLVAEYLEPVGQHHYDIAINGGALAAPIQKSLDVDVSGKYMFAVALADLTVSGNNVSGSIEPLAGDEHFEKDLVVDGRLAFYLKGKVKGKYLVTAQADTQEREISELFTGFWNADPQDIFRRLDPDQYYPVYGDDSTTYRDVDTMGRLYVRVDWDKSQALWGNFNTGITGTEYGQYSRSLYGGALSWRSRRSTALGEAGSELKAFGSEAQTAPGHSEFLGTGGSLYYLKHTDVLPGSAQVVLEVRDPTTGRTESRVQLLEGADYEIDSMQGRIILSRPLSMITRENVPTLTRDTPLDGLSQVLLVDYEYLPHGFDADDVTAGVRGKHWFGDHFAIGGTYIDENRAGDDYTLSSVDLTLQAGRGTYLKLEHTRSEATSAPVFFSSNGGLSFTQINPVLGAREGEASAVEARANFKELGWTALDWSAGAWWRQVDAGFSVSRFDTGADIEEHGAELLGQFTPNFNIYSRYSLAERGAESLEQAQVTVEWRMSDFASFSAELRRIEEQRLTGDATGVLAALQYRHRFGTSLEVYGTAQFTLEDDGGNYADNDSVTLGAKYLFGNLSSVNAEVTSGDRGDAAMIGAEYRRRADHSIYANYTYSTDRSAYDPLFNNRRDTGWTLGQRWRLSNQVNVFNESQWLKSPSESGLANTFGMDFYPAQGWTLGFTLQHADLDTVAGGVDRDAVSINGGRTSNATQWQSKLEWRRDTGAERREQWVTTNYLTHKVNESFRIAARFNYSRTEDELLAQAGAKFVEGNLGFAWRPWDSTRWALFGRYTYLYDVSSLPQIGTNVAYYDQRSQVLSLEGVYMPSDHWEFAGKLARREGEVRMGRLEGVWADSATTFVAGQVRYELRGQWHALGEFRWLGVKQGGDKSGFLVGVDRDVGKNFRVGVGYNFTDFSDDLTNFDYDHRGFFLNLTGRY
ncbi:hypothetical protein [Thermomonas sp.]|uniref:hypothetical protein n=1 Tax=Thermomonas sp. TaxID=1971895 RepID=UPI0039E5FCD1